MQSNFLFVFAIASVVCGISLGLPYKDCGSVGTLQSFNISDCQTAPCIFKKGTTYTLDISFVPASNSSTASNEVTGIIAGVPVPFPLPQEDACKNNITCPLEAGKTYKETISLTVLQQYPSISLVAKFTILDNQKNSIICVIFPAKIVA